MRILPEQSFTILSSNFSHLRDSNFIFYDRATSLFLLIVASGVIGVGAYLIGRSCYLTVRTDLKGNSITVQNKVDKLYKAQKILKTKTPTTVMSKELENQLKPNPYTPANPLEPLVASVKKPLPRSVNFTLLVSSVTDNYYNYPQGIRPIAKTVGYLCLRIRTFYQRFKTSIQQHTHLWTDAAISHFMIVHLNNEDFRGCSQVQLKSIQKTCQILIQRGNHFQAGLQQIHNQIDDHIGNKAIKIQSTFRKYSAQIQIQKREMESLFIRRKIEEILRLIRIRKEGEEEAVIKVQSLCRRYLARSRFKRKREAIISLQNSIRLFFLQKKIRQIKHAAAITIQKNYRTHLAANFRKKLEAKKIYTHKLYDQLKKSSKQVQAGYGEYVVYRDESSQTIDQETFNSIYIILEKYRGTCTGSSENLISNMKSELKKIAPSLEIIFIPKTLYELIYIQASIEEEVSDRICRLQDPEGYESFNDGLKGTSSKPNTAYINKKLEKCWHLACFNHREFVSKLAARINNLIVEKFHPKGFLTGREIILHAENQIAYLKKHRVTFPETMGTIGYCGSKGASVNFGYDQSNGDRIVCFGMGLNSDRDAQIVRNAIALECDKMAQNAFILYRGGDFNEDGYVKEEIVKKTSFSYGTSLFAGCFVDGTATVFYYTITKKRDPYAIVVAYRDYAKSPFYIPSIETISQLSGQGEYFHPRSRLPFDVSKEETIRGIFCASDSRPQELTSQSNAKEIVTQLAQYHSSALRLSPL